MAKETNKEPRQVLIKIQCDEGFCSKTLEELAKRYKEIESADIPVDEEEYDFEYETPNAMVESTIDEE